ncbi:MAG: efflux RND transporter periplasmic adaptor subunit [Saprospiraceae bacterium]|nr:efflux RND transporter periplasmic adaptor subunit [Saprospiraceae bacterium]
MLRIVLLSSILFFSCRREKETIKPVSGPISESIYAAGFIKSKNQYQVFSTVNGIIDQVYVSEGDTVKKGSLLLSISNETQRLNKENAELAAQFSDLNANQGKLNEAKQSIDLARYKMANDSILYSRQAALWQQQIGTKIELEQRELALQNSKTAHSSAIVRYEDLKRQLDFSSLQSKKNLLISSKLQSDYILKSEIDGIVYSFTKTKGEWVGLQTALAIIGDAKNFILEMQVDEYDIFKIRKGLIVLVTMDSYKDHVFEAILTKVNPMMNERSKTFLVEAEFIQPPSLLYPNITFEANIVIQSKEKAILIPRNYLLQDSTVIKISGDTVIVRTGLKDYNKIEILSGVEADDELIKPNE